MKNFIIIGAILLIIIIIGITLYVNPLSQKTTTITNFEECIAAGFPVMESYPRQCKFNDQTFVEKVTSEPTPPSGPQSNDIQVTAPQTNTTIQSPLQITGQAKGSWYFEASFPITLLDGNGNQIAQTTAQAQGDWMTTNFVPFSATLTFNTPATSTGTLVLKKDNPSGLPANDDQITIPINF